MKPIVRGRCTDCGFSRNLWVNELVDLPACDHVRLGCRGRMEVAYAGPKWLMSAELDRASQNRPSLQSQACCGTGAASSDGEDLARLHEMGFPEDAARRALAEVGQSEGYDGSGRLEAALNLLTACPSQAASVPASSASAAGSHGAIPVETCVCAICTEDLEPANAAMRCTGQHGKRHYYHAHCLSQWIQQCRRDKQPPSCPECRGELQVRARRLRDFLAENSSKLDRDDVEALRAVHDAAASADGDGWSSVQKEAVLKGLAIGAGVAVAGLAIAAAVSAFSNKRGRDDRQ